MNLSYQQTHTNTFIEAYTPHILKIKEPANLNLRDVRDVVKDYELGKILLDSLSRPNLIAWFVKSFSSNGEGESCITGRKNGQIQHPACEDRTRGHKRSNPDSLLNLERTGKQTVY